MKGNFFAYIYRMHYINRWSLMKNMTTENLAEHGLDCAVIAHAISLIRVRIFNQTDISPEKCAVYALFHDAAEIITGDLPTPIKYFNRQIVSAYKEIEENAKNQLYDMLYDEFYDDYKSIFNPPGNYAQIVHYADKICAYIKCVDELKSGNNEFKTAWLQLHNLLSDCFLPEVRFFIDKYIDAFSKTLDELKG